jgi:ubiquinone biosynthesis monooxygenase Coq7
MRHYSRLDRVLNEVDKALRTVYVMPTPPARDNPAKQHAQAELSNAEKNLAGRLMRINHTGEVCAQALYQSQALTAELPRVRDKMAQAAMEENDHLNWTETRLRELGTHTSYFNPLWYAGSFAIGAAAGLAGDKWSLGFVAETERQVVEHLNEHLLRMPENDKKTRSIMEQMREDENHHATTALKAGAAELPTPVKRLMRLVSKVMTRTTYWV